MPPKIDSAIYPVEALKDTLTALEAAVFESLQQPRKRAVHKVRTTTRRIEAQLILLPLTGSFPNVEKEAGNISRILKKLRSAAGHVRDLDVQRDLIASEADKTPADAALAREAKQLRQHLRHRRKTEAGELVDLLQSVKRKLPKRVKALLEAIESAEDNTVPEGRILTLIREWYSRQVKPHWQPAQSGDPDELHAIRKIAKLARYLAETAPDSAARAHRLAAHFETLQKAGGEWHDWLLLAQAAREHLGRKAALPTRFSSSANLALADFRRQLGYRM